MYKRGIIDCIGNKFFLYMSRLCGQFTTSVQQKDDKKLLACKILFIKAFNVPTKTNLNRILIETACH